MKKIEPIEWLKIISASVCSFVSVTGIIYFLKSVIDAITRGQASGDLIVGIFFISAIAIVCSIIPIILIKFLRKKIREIQKEDTGFEKIPKKSNLLNDHLQSLSSSKQLAVLSARNSLANSRFLVGFLFILTVLFIVISSLKLSHLDLGSYKRSSYDYSDIDPDPRYETLGMPSHLSELDNKEKYYLSDFQFLIVVAFDNLIVIIPTLLMMIWVTTSVVRYLRLKAVVIKLEQDFISE